MISTIFRDRWIPELELIESKEIRSVIFRQASRAPSIVVWNIALCVGAASAVLYWFASIRAAVQSLGKSVEAFVFPIVLFLAIGFMCDTIFIVVVRTRMRRIVRRLIAEYGVPICIACGYNLTTNTSGICPECGSVCKRA